jgi:hypothetical protein
MKNIILFLFVAFSLISCTHVYYAPNTPNVPLFSQKGETRINALFSTTSSSAGTGGELQAAHAVGRNAAIMINAFAARSSNEVEKGKGRYLEFGMGGFRTPVRANSWVGEVYGGGGIGTVRYDFENKNNSKVNFSRFFLQPSLGYRIKNFEAAFVPRLSFVHWTVKEANFTSQDQGSAIEITAIRDFPNFISFEPTILIRGGGEHVKLQLAVTGLHSKRGQSAMLLERSNVSLGISINLDSRKGGKKE